MALSSEKSYGFCAMGKLVNLNKFRKQKAKLEKEQKAETNRRLHGRTKAERARELLQKRKLETQVDGARLDAPEKPKE
jgi:hypothetical protein